MVRPKYWLTAGLSFSLVGAVLACALEDADATVLGVNLQPLGGVLFAAGVLLIAGAAIGGVGNKEGADSSSIQSVGGLIAVVAGITAVTALAIVTLTQLGDEKDSIVAITSSAFGIISAVVGAYLGIKISSDTTAKASDEAKDATIARHEAEIAKHQVSAMKKEAEHVAPNKAEQIVAAGNRARDRAALAQSSPPMGGGA